MKSLFMKRIDNQVQRRLQKEHVFSRSYRIALCQLQLLR